ncbi:hypothetical protein KC573_02275 [candidate division WWE3 bacterium]|uniref:Uncharacterized protein n=1 Tax=candidate division WWE3 bacterium TaxID=2053526 RepID=A0A955RX95_UNCKA|nr:hypothetical protein [candidate division WWE3 bacterium]
MPQIVVTSSRGVGLTDGQKKSLLEFMIESVTESMGWPSHMVGGMWITPELVVDEIELQVKIEFSAPVWKFWKYIKWARLFEAQLHYVLQRTEIVPVGTHVAVWVCPQWQALFRDFHKN